MCLTQWYVSFVSDYQNDFCNSKKITNCHLIVFWPFRSSKWLHRSWRDVLDTTLCDQVCQWLATSRCFFPDKWHDEISKEKHYVRLEMVRSFTLTGNHNRSIVLIYIYITFKTFTTILYSWSATKCNRTIGTYWVDHSPKGRRMEFIIETG
jgi:hypothetical protein